MRPRKTRDIAGALKSKGFIEKQSHHTFFALAVNGLRSGVRTKLSHGVREYGASLLHQIAQDLGLTNEELERLLDCPMSGQQYVDLMRLRGRVRES